MTTRTMTTRTMFGQPVALHSQPACRQDEWVIETTRGMRGGYFVEVGGNDGLRHSNTLTLERDFGWRGLLVEADPDLYRASCLNRSRCDHANVAVSVTDDSEVAFSKAGAWGGLMSFLPRDWVVEHYSRGTPVIRVRTLSLRTLLSRHSPQGIDYLSLDIEGAEVPVLEEYFRAPNRTIRCMTVEYRQDAGDLMRLQRILEPHGFMLDRVQGWDAMFVNRLYL